jgi:hypothetical protein
VLLHEVTAIRRDRVFCVAHYTILHSKHQQAHNTAVRLQEVAAVHGLHLASARVLWPHVTTSCKAEASPHVLIVRTLGLLLVLLLCCSHPAPCCTPARCLLVPVILLTMCLSAAAAAVLSVLHSCQVPSTALTCLRFLGCCSWPRSCGCR